MSLKKQISVFMVLLLAPFFSNSLFAGVPPTTSYTATFQCVGIAPYKTDTEILADQDQNSTAWGFAIGCSTNVQPYTNGQGDSCTFWSHWVSSAPSDSQSLETVYRCTNGGTFTRYEYPFTSAWTKTLVGDGEACLDPAYPELIDGSCEELGSTCGFDNPVFIAPSSIQQNSLCVTQANGAQCEYSATTEQSGVNNGVNFTPTSEGCSCDSLSSIPCADSGDSNDGGLAPDASGCIQTGGVSWCSADPEQACQTNSEGVTSCDTNCGYINDNFYCGDSTLPDSTACESGDTRTECSGLATGDCPIGFDCSGNNNPSTEQETACILNDTRPQCDGAAVGEFPQNDLSGIEGLLEQGNRNTQAILEELSNDNTNDMVSQRDSQLAINQAEMDSSDSAEQSSIDIQSAGEAGLISGTMGNVGYFGSLVSGLTVTPTGSCVPWAVTWSEGKVTTIDICDIAPTIKTLLAWLINVSLFIYIFMAFTRRASPEVK